MKRKIDESKRKSKEKQTRIDWIERIGMELNKNRIRFDTTSRRENYWKIMERKKKNGKNIDELNSVGLDWFNMK